MTSKSDNNDVINCWIYKSNRKDEMYLYLCEEEAFDPVPEDLLASFGETTFVMELELSPQRKLARADVDAVIKSLKEDKYYLQIPPKLRPDLHFGD